MAGLRVAQCNQLSDPNLTSEFIRALAAGAVVILGAGG